jgi:hypothetical protein
MPSDATVLDALAFQSEFGGELLRGIDTIVGTVVSNLHTGGRGLSFKANLGLDRLGACEAHLVDDSELGASGVAENSPAAEFLTGESVPAS